MAQFGSLLKLWEKVLRKETVEDEWLEVWGTPQGIRVNIEDE